MQPGGSLFFTTLNKTWISYIVAIISAEKIFRFVPVGTHDWNKFIPPSELENKLNTSKFVLIYICNMCKNCELKILRYISC